MEDNIPVCPNVGSETIAANGLSQEMVLPVGISSRPEQLSEAFGQQQKIHYFWDEANVTSVGELRVEGWAVCSTGIAKVAVYLDGKCLGEAELGLPRQDVSLHFEAIPMARFSGFRFHQSLPGLAAGHHETRIVIRNVLGDERSETKELHAAGAASPVVADPQLAVTEVPVTEVPEFHLQLDSPRVVHGAAVEPVIGGLTIEG